MAEQTLEKTSVESAFLDNLYYLSINDLDAWINLWHEDGIYEVPFAPAGTATLVQGRSKVYDYMKFVLSAMKPVPGESKHWLFWDIKTYTTTERETVIAEYKGRSKIAINDHIYTQRYIARVTTNNGKIILYREYWNPLIFLEGLGSLEIAQDAFATLSFGS